MSREKLPDAATDPLYEHGPQRSKVEAEDIEEDIAAIQWVAQQRKPEIVSSSGQTSGCFTSWLQRKKPK